MAQFAPAADIQMKPVAKSTKAPKVKLRPVLATMDDCDEIIHWALNCMTYVEPFEMALGHTAEDARAYYEHYVPICINSGLTFKLLDEKGLFAGDLNVPEEELIGYRLTCIETRDEPEPKFEMSPRWKLFTEILNDLYPKVWELNPEAKKLVTYHGVLIVPSYHGRTDFVKELLSAFLDYEKLKADGVYGAYSGYANPHSINMALKSGHQVLAKIELSKYRLPDGRPITVPGSDSLFLIFHKF